MKKKWTIVAFSICIAIVAGLIATIIVLASGTQGVGTSVSVLYVATDIEGTVSAKYSKVNKNTSAVISTTDMVTSSGSKTVSFLSTAPTTTNLLNPTESNISLTAEQDLVITYSFTAVAPYYATLEYKDNSTNASNIEFSYALNDESFKPEMSMPIEVTSDKTTTYSIKLRIANTARNANLSGSLNWALTKDGGKTPSGSDEKVAISFANSSDNCKINSAKCAVVYNSDKSKFKITGITPTISNGSVTNLADLTNANGSEFYYFATNSAVVGTTGYTDPGTTYYISGLGTSANPACETWYDTPTNKTTLYAVFMKPTHTSVPTTVGELSGEVIFSHSITSLPKQTYLVQYIYVQGSTNTFSVAVVPNSITKIYDTVSSTSFIQSKREIDSLLTVPQPIVSEDMSIFFSNSKLKSIELPNSIDEIGQYSFANCSGLTKITIPNSVTSIDTGAFYIAGASADNNKIIYDGTLENFKIIANLSETEEGSCFDTTSGGGVWNHNTGTFTVITNDNPAGVSFDVRYLMCLSLDTEITCYDEKRKRWYKKKLRDLTYKDKIVVWNFDEGKFDVVEPIFLTRTQVATRYTVVKLSDGAVLKLIGENDSKRHRMFVKETGRFDYVNKSLVGKTTFNEKGEFVNILNVEYVNGEIEFANIITKYHFNCFANGILTSCRLSNMYKIKDMKYVKDNREFRPITDFKGVEEKYYDGLRLAEQPYNICQDQGDARYVDYVDFVNSWKNNSK